MTIDDSPDVEYGVIAHSPEAIEQWVLDLKERFNGQSVAICLELNIGPIVACLQKYSFITLFHVSPKALAKYRNAFTQSGAKDDPTDAYFQLDYFLNHGATLQRVTLDSEDTRIIQQLVKQRRAFVEQKCELCCRIRAKLKCYYPLMLTLFNDVDTSVFCDFVERWPDLSTLKKARSNTLVNFLKSRRSAQGTLNERRIQMVKAAKPLTEDEGVIMPNRYYVLALIQQLRQVLSTIKDYDSEIAYRFELHQDSQIFESFPASGAVNAPRLMAAFGSDRTRFSSALEVSTSSAIAPVTKRSGTKTIVHWRYQCAKFERQTFVEWAGQTVMKSFWARAFYEEKRSKGKSHQATLRALAFKWIRILYSCWKNKTLYDETQYLLKMRKKGNAFTLPK